jgi:glycosyltransferase involved in cell wall biosynthesis
VCVLPSRYEPFGTVILEAWASRTPLVACTAQGPAAHIVDGVNGLLAPVDEPAALGAAIRRLLADEALRKNLIENGFEAYRRDFTPEAVIAQWIGFYKGLDRNDGVTCAA